MGFLSFKNKILIYTGFHTHTHTNKKRQKIKLKSKKWNTIKKENRGRRIKEEFLIDYILNGRWETYANRAAETF